MLPLISLDCLIIRHQTFINLQNFQNRIRFNLKLEALQSLEIRFPLQGPLEFSCSFYLSLPRTKIRLKNQIYGFGGGGEATLLQSTNGPVEMQSNTQTLNVSLRLLGKKKIQPALSTNGASLRDAKQQFYQGVPTEPPIAQQPRSERLWAQEEWVVGLLFLGLVALSCRAWFLRRRTTGGHLKNVRCLSAWQTSQRLILGRFIGFILS